MFSRLMLGSDPLMRWHHCSGMGISPSSPSAFLGYWMFLQFQRIERGSKRADGCESHVCVYLRRWGFDYSGVRLAREVSSLLKSVVGWVDGGRTSRSSWRW